MPRYILSWNNPAEHLYDISITFTAREAETRLLLPAWRPGRYLIQNYAANVREWSANLRKTGKSIWVAEANPGEEVTVRYRFYAAVLDAGSSFLDESEAYFNGSNLFMMVEPLRDEPCTLTIAAPADWRIETQLRSAAVPAAGQAASRRRERDAPEPAGEDAGASERTFVARNYDHLIDSPAICAESMTRHSFIESGARIHMIFRGDAGIDTEQFVEPVRAIVRAQAAMFGGLPLTEYGFLYHLGERWHGVEHEDSSSMIVKRAQLLGASEGDEGIDHFLSLTSHEFFHIWNVKRILPRAFAPYDYMTETPTCLLWAMEGITSYYGELALLRAGVWTEARYLEHLRTEIEVLENSPARFHQSLAQASFDGWLQNDVHDRANASISFYNKGEIVACLLDLELRHRTGKSLDDVMRYFWSEQRVLDEDAIERAVERVSGEDLSDFFKRYVYGTEPLPYQESFARFGLAFAAEASEELSLGAKLKTSGGILSIESVTSGGAAAEAGLISGDELLAIDGFRVSSEAAVRRVLKAAGEGTSMELLAARGGLVQRRTIVARRDPAVKITLLAIGENELRQSWLRSGE